MVGTEKGADVRCNMPKYLPQKEKCGGKEGRRKGAVLRKERKRRVNIFFRQRDDYKSLFYALKRLLCFFLRIERLVMT